MGVQVNRPQPVRYIIEEVTKSFGMVPGDILAQNKGEPVRTVRQATMYIASKVTRHPSTVLAKPFGRESSTIRHELKRIQVRMRDNRWLRLRVEQLIGRLEGELRTSLFPLSICFPLQLATVNPDREDAMSQEQEGMLL